MEALEGAPAGVEELIAAQSVRVAEAELAYLGHVHRAVRPMIQIITVHEIERDKLGAGARGGVVSKLLFLFLFILRIRPHKLDIPQRQPAEMRGVSEQRREPVPALKSPLCEAHVGDRGLLPKEDLDRMPQRGVERVPRYPRRLGGEIDASEVARLCEQRRERDHRHRAVRRPEISDVQLVDMQRDVGRALERGEQPRAARVDGVVDLEVDPREEVHAARGQPAAADARALLEGGVVVVQMVDDGVDELLGQASEPRRHADAPGYGRVLLKAIG